MVPNDRRYTKSHEWVMIDGDTVTIGLSDYAQDQLGDIVFVELPQVGETVEPEARLAVVESIKAASDVFAPVGGEIIEANEALDDAPEKINESPWTAWIAKIKVANLNEDTLLDAAAYDAFLLTEEAKG